MLYRTPFFLPILYPDLLWRVPTKEKQLYLTFDDGPVPGPTEFVLETLDKYDVKASFFCIGENIAKHPGIYKRIIESGHAVGNHTYNHLNGWKTSHDQYVQNALKCKLEMQQAGNSMGKRSDFFRPPYGRITRSQIKSLSDYKIVMWDVLTNDYNASVSENDCLGKSIAVTRPGSIIVFHDSMKAEKNMTYALPLFIEFFLARGFKFDSLPT